MTKNKFDDGLHETVSTVVAISTPPGVGGVGIVRISGPKSLAIAKKIFQRSSAEDWSAQKLYYGKINDLWTTEVVDDGYASFFRAPHSFTGEDVVEFQLHGNPILLSKIIELCCELGAKLAGPGEFTKRAYLNGKMDLLQAEAVAELIHSQSMIEVQRSRLRLDGKLSSHLATLRNEVIDVLAEIEANVDFPEEKIDLASQEKILKQLNSIEDTSKLLLRTFEQNQKIHSGFRVVLVGKPNVGKSSLFNALLKNDRAIVTPIAGTTRDVLSEEIILDGYRIKILDTAGLRKDISDEIEKEGVVRSGNEMSKADLILWISSATETIDPNDLELFQNLPSDQRWLVWSKIDLQPPGQNFSQHFEKTFLLSAKNNLGVDELLDALRQKVRENSTGDFGGGISNDRQRELLLQLMNQLQVTQKMMIAQAEPELMAIELRQGFHSLNRILGREENMEDVYDRIFSKFCIGK